MIQMPDTLRYNLCALWLTLILAQTTLAEKTLHIGIQHRNLPYMNYDGTEPAEGILVDATRALCRDMQVDCVFYASDLEERLDALKHRHLDAVILSDQFISDEQARGLSFYPAFCTVKPVFIHADPARKQTLMYQSVGVPENSYLEFHLQNHFPLNIRIVPYALMENGMFDLLHRKIDVLLASTTFFASRAKALFAKDGTFILPSVATPAADYNQPERAMSLAVRKNHQTLKQKLSDLSRRHEGVYCADLLPDHFRLTGLTVD